MSVPEIKIVETVAVDYSARDGQKWSNERDAQNYNAERSMMKILGKTMVHENYNNIRNLAAEAPSLDIITLRNVMDRYLHYTLPAFMALEGPFAFGTGRQIETSDGRKFVNRHKAALHVLELEFERLWAEQRISVEGRRAITNTNKFTPVNTPEFDRQCTRFQFMWNLQSFFKLTDDAGNPRLGYEQKFRDALQAIILERSKPIKGKKRPAKKSA